MSEWSDFFKKLGTDVLGVDLKDYTPTEALEAAIEKLKENRGENMENNQMEDDKELLGGLVGWLKECNYTMTYEDNIFIGTYLEFTKENSGATVRITLSKELRVAMAAEGVEQWMKA
jgi:AAA+ ATPase superfamily predicted ATPase